MKVIVRSKYGLIDCDYYVDMRISRDESGIWSLRGRVQGGTGDILITTLRDGENARLALEALDKCLSDGGRVCDLQKFQQSNI